MNKENEESHREPNYKATQTCCYIHRMKKMKWATQACYLKVEQRNWRKPHGVAIKQIEQRK